MTGVQTFALPIYRGDVFRAPGEVQREGAAVGEAVQRAAAGVAARFDPVLRLIEEGAGLLPSEEVGDEAHLAFEELHRAGRLAQQHPLALREAFVGADADVVTLDDGARLDQVVEQLREQLAARVGGLGQRLDAEAVGVAVEIGRASCRERVYSSV